MIFVDSNVPMYVAGRDHPLRGPAQRFLERARAGDIEICTSTEVLQEILYRYVALNRRDLAGSVYDLFVQSVPHRAWRHAGRHRPRTATGRSPAVRRCA